MKAWHIWLGLGLALTACNKGKDDTGTDGTGDGDGAGRASLTIESPSEGETFTEGEEITFEVSAEYEDGTTADLSEVTWSAGDWSGDGSTVSTSDLGVGAWAVSVEGEVDDRDLSGEVNITIEDGGSGSGGDSGSGGSGGSSGGSSGGGGETVNFAGSLNADVIVDFDGTTYPFECPGTVTFSIDGSGVMTGVGDCRIDDIDTDVTFVIDGADTTGALAGNLVLDVDGTAYETPYTGSRTTSDHVTCSYDSTFASSDGELRIVGTFTGDPI